MRKKYEARGSIFELEEGRKHSNEQTSSIIPDLVQTQPFVRLMDWLTELGEREEDGGADERRLGEEGHRSGMCCILLYHGAQKKKGSPSEKINTNSEKKVHIGRFLSITHTWRYNKQTN